MKVLQELGPAARKKQMIKQNKDLDHQSLIIRRQYKEIIILY